MRGRSLILLGMRTKLSLMWKMDRFYMGVLDTNEKESSLHFLQDYFHKIPILMFFCTA